MMDLGTFSERLSLAARGWRDGLARRKAATAPPEESIFSALDPLFTQGCDVCAPNCCIPEGTGGQQQTYVCMGDSCSDCACDFGCVPCLWNGGIFPTGVDFSAGERWARPEAYTRDARGRIAPLICHAPGPFPLGACFEIAPCWRNGGRECYDDSLCDCGDAYPRCYDFSCEFNPCPNCTPCDGPPCYPVPGTVTSCFIIEGYSIPNEGETLRCRFCDGRGNDPSVNLTCPQSGTLNGSRLGARQSTRLNGACLENFFSMAVGAGKSDPPGCGFGNIPDYWTDFRNETGVNLFSEYDVSYGSPRLRTSDTAFDITPDALTSLQIRNAALQAVFETSRPPVLDRVRMPLPRNPTRPNNVLDYWWNEWEAERRRDLIPVAEYPGRLLGSGCACTVNVFAWRAKTELLFMILEEVNSRPCDDPPRTPEWGVWPSMRWKLSAEMAYQITVDPECPNPPSINRIGFSDYPDDGIVILANGIEFTDWPSRVEWKAGRGALTKRRWENVGRRDCPGGAMWPLCNVMQRIPGYESSAMGTRETLPSEFEDDIHSGTISISRIVFWNDYCEDC